MFVLGQYQTTRGATPRSTQTNCKAATPWKNRQTTTRQLSLQTGRTRQLSVQTGRQQQQQFSVHTGRQQQQQQLSGQTLCSHIKWLVQWQERKRFSNQVNIFWCCFCHLVKLSVWLAWQFLIQLGAEKIYIYTEDCRPRQLNFLHIKIPHQSLPVTPEVHKLTGSGSHVAQHWHVSPSSENIYEYWLPNLQCSEKRKLESCHCMNPWEPESGVPSLWSSHS